MPTPRIDRSEVTDVFGIMPKVEPCPEADLQDLAVRPGEHVTTKPGDMRCPH